MSTSALTVPGGPPKNFTADVRSSSQILLMWQPPSNEIQNGRIRLYTASVFEVQTDTNFSYTLYSQPSEDSALLVQSLHPYYDYMCNVSAVTIGPGPYTSPLTVRTFEDGECLPFLLDKQEPHHWSFAHTRQLQTKSLILHTCKPYVHYVCHFGVNSIHVMVDFVNVLQ